MYEQVPVTPATVNLPFDASKPVVEATVSDDVPPTRVTVVPSPGFPVQPVIPVNVLPPEVPVYEQVPLMPASVNWPLGVSKPVSETTFNVAPVRSWSPSTVVVAGRLWAPVAFVLVFIVTVALSAGDPVQPVTR